MTPQTPDDTIVALASAAGAAPRGIIRLSGPHTAGCLEKCLHRLQSSSTQSETASSTAPWQRHRVPFRSPIVIPLEDNGVQVAAELAWWPGKRSYTGQPLAEIHMIGSPPLLDAVINRLCLCGARPARPGEFTLRAFLAGRIDLVQAEAVLGVIDAADHLELQSALSQLAGGLSSHLQQLRANLLDLLADLEAGLDFVDEDIEFVSQTETISRLTAAQQQLDQLARAAQERMQTVTALRVVLSGLPNAGKSSLFNSLANGAATALVSSAAGTTRDYLSATLCWEGLDVELIDTAGWDASTGGIEEAAEAFRQQQIERADLILHCSAVDQTSTEISRDQQLLDMLQATQTPWLHLKTKSDLAGTAKEIIPSTSRPATFKDWPATAPLQISVVGNQGVAEIPAIVCKYWHERQHLRGARQFVGTTAVRCRESLRLAGMSIESALAATRLAAGDEVVAWELRDALNHLGVILGLVYTDDILDRVFSKFCIGK